MESMDDKKMCTAVVLDIQQAFDKVWHKRPPLQNQEGIAESNISATEIILNGKILPN
jgi:hypothetical protein